MSRSQFPSSASERTAELLPFVGHPVPDNEPLPERTHKGRPDPAAGARNVSLIGPKAHTGQPGGNEVLPLRGTSGQRFPRIAIKSDGRILFIDLREVITVEAQGNYVKIQRQAAAHMLRESISVMAEKLKPYGFLRIHRSMLVNALYVEEIRPWKTGSYGLRIRGGKEYTVTRSYKEILSNLADLWIGMDNFACVPVPNAQVHP